MSTEGQRKSRKQEQRITKRLRQIGIDARQQMASGSIWFAKSDVISELFQIEAKTKAKQSKSITIQKDWMEKIEEEAFQARKTPALVFSFGDSSDYFIIPDKHFLALIEELLELRKLRGDI